MYIRPAYVAAGAVFFTNCASTTTIGSTCAPTPNDHICVGDMTVPRKYEARFKEGANQAIVALLSPEFEKKLASFIEQHAQEKTIAAPWKGHDVADIVAAERGKFTVKLGVTTYDGPGALLYKVFDHNIAFEGRPDDAGNREVPMNRFALRGRTPSDVANTLAHEASHAAGLTHPDSAGNLPRAFCEPPYVIGTIIQQIVDGESWSWSANGDCKCFEPGAKQESCVP